MYYCLIHITFLNQLLQVKDKEFLYCWTVLQEIMGRGNFIKGERHGNYCGYYQPNIDISNQRLIIQTLKHITEHLAQYRSELSGYKIIFSAYKHDDVEQIFLDLRSIIINRVEGEKLWFTESAVSIFSSYAQFLPSGSIYEYQHNMQDSEHSLFAKFVSTEENIRAVQNILKRVKVSSSRTLLLFTADAYSGMGPLIEATLRAPSAPDLFCIQLTCLKDLSILESFRSFLLDCDIIALQKKEYSHHTDKAFSAMLMDIERVTDNNAVILPEQARQYIIQIFSTLLQLYIDLMGRLNLTPYIFIDAIDFCSSQDVYFLDAVVQAGDPNNDIILIASASEACQLESVAWNVKLYNLNLTGYDCTVFQRQYSHIKLDTIKMIQQQAPPAALAFFQLLGEAVRSKDSPAGLLSPLLPMHCQLLYIIRKSLAYHISIEYLIDMMSQGGYKSEEVHDTTLFLIRHGYLRNINTLYFSRHAEELFLQKKLDRHLQGSVSNLDRLIATYFADLHFRGEIQLPQRFFYENFLMLSFGYWIQNVYLHCERFISMGVAYTYLDTAVFMKHIKNVKSNKQHIMKPVILILRAKEYIFTRKLDDLERCIALLRKLDVMPEYLRTPWNVVLAQYHQIMGDNPEDAAKKILKKPEDKKKCYQSIACCILGIQAMYKQLKAESTKYFSFALSYAEPHHNLHAAMYAYLVTCSSSFLSGNFADVRSYAEDAIQYTNQYAVYIWKTAFLIVLARLEFEIGHYKKAAEIFEQAGNIAEQYGYTTLLQSARCWEARSIGYGGNWSGTHKILRQSPSSLERSYFLAEVMYFSQNYEVATEFIYEAIKNNEATSGNSTLFCAPYCWTNAWDFIEHLFVEKVFLGKVRNATALTRLLNSFAVLINTASGELDAAVSMAETIINDTKHSSVDQNFPLYYHACAIALLEERKNNEAKNQEYSNLLSQAVRFLKKRSSNIENRFERQHFVSYNYWNALLLSHAKEYNITN